MQGVAAIAFLTAVCGFVACSAWFRAARVLGQHGALDSRFKSSFSNAAVGTALFLGLGSVAILVGLYGRAFA